jgi:hypothetical protein
MTIRSSNLNELNGKPGLQPTTEEYIIDPYLPANEAHIIGGRSGAGKTHLLYQILDRFRDQLKPILYVAGDRSAKHYKRLFTKLGIEPWPVVSLIDHDANQLGMDEILENVESHQRCFLWLNALINGMETKPKVVVLDPAQRFIPCKNLNDQTSAANGFAAIMSWAVKNKITVILVWHVSKTKTWDLNDVFDRLTGSHGVQGHTSTKVFLDVPGSYGKEDKPIYLFVRGQHFQDRIVRLLRDDKGAFRLATNVDFIAMEFPVYRVLPKEPTQREHIIALVKNAGNGLSSLSKTTIDRQLKQLVEKGYAQKPAHGMYCRKPRRVSLNPSTFI